MLLEIPSSLYAYTANQCHSLSPSIELIYYNNTKNFSKYEVKLNKNMFLFILKGSKKITLYNEEISLVEGYGAFVVQDMYVMSEIASQTKNCFSSLMIMVDDEKLIELWRSAVRLYSLDGNDTLLHKEVANWTNFEQSLCVKSSLATLELFSNENKKIPYSLVEAKLQELLFYIASTNSGKDLGEIISKLKNKDKNCKLKTFMEKNYTQRWTLDEFAEHFGFSLSTFKRMFKEAYRIAPKTWINDRRLDKAASEIIKKDISLLEIALDLGFSGSSQFSKAFKNKYNCPPSQFMGQLKFHSKVI